MQRPHQTAYGQIADRVRDRDPRWRLRTHPAGRQSRPAARRRRSGHPVRGKAARPPPAPRSSWSPRDSSWPGQACGPWLCPAPSVPTDGRCRAAMRGRAGPAASSSAATCRAGRPQAGHRLRRSDRGPRSGPGPPAPVHRPSGVLPVPGNRRGRPGRRDQHVVLPVRHSSRQRAGQDRTAAARRDDARLGVPRPHDRTHDQRDPRPPRQHRRVRGCSIPTRCSSRWPAAS